MAEPLLPRRHTVGLAGLGVLGAGLGAGLAGCGADGRARVAAPSDASNDDDVVARARGELAARETMVVRVMRHHPPLRARLRPLVTLHRRHEEVLAAGADATTTPALTVPPGQEAALAAVLRQERTLQAELASLAVRAESGTLGRVLAGMAAGTAQRLTLLERSDADR